MRQNVCQKEMRTITRNNHQHLSIDGLKSLEIRGRGAEHTLHVQSINREHKQSRRTDALTLNMRLLFRVVLLLALLAPLRCRKSQNKLTKGDRAKGHTVRLVLDPALTPKLPPSSIENTADLSVSPWTYRVECVSSRVPQCLSQAQCLTSGCLNPESGREDLSLEAKPIYYQLLVLHRVPRHRHRRPRGREKGYDFRLGTEVVSVGCTCVRPSVLPQD